MKVLTVAPSSSAYDGTVASGTAPGAAAARMRPTASSASAFDAWRKKPPQRFSRSCTWAPRRSSTRSSTCTMAMRSVPATVSRPTPPPRGSDTCSDSQAAARADGATLRSSW